MTHRMRTSAIRQDENHYIEAGQGNQVEGK